ncbi:hypothetical protein ACIRP2_23950 [Streptomyces sp. NPDC101194]|uniref:hypothetical protein n=1 Tax=Streptomyces sp. NPDC101194 TaxID=3366127 RepID=UPI00380565E9
MPDRESLPAGWRGEADPKVRDAKDALDDCSAMAVTCTSAGLVAMGSDSYDEGTVNRPEGDREHRADVFVFSFDSPEGAKKVMKNLVGAGRKGESPQPVKIDAGAQDTEAYSTSDSGVYKSQVVMRVDKVVIGILGEELKQPRDIQPIAETLVDRVEKASQGESSTA